MKKFIVLLSILCVCCFSCFALVPLKKATAETAVSTTSEKAETTTTESSSELSTISNKIDDLTLVSKGTKEELKAELNTYTDGLYAALQAALKESTKTKFFCDLGAAFGVKDKALTYGVTGDMGLRFGKGLMVKIGAIYMVGNDFQNISWGLENLTMTATIGWEW